MADRKIIDVVVNSEADDSVNNRVKKIVAVDDCNVVLKILKGVLDKDLYELHAFSSGSRALQFLMQKEKKPDLIILDIEMPEMDGYAILEQIKKMKHLDDVPVIFLTANNEKQQVVKAATDGIKDYVIKPIDKDILMRKIYLLLENMPTGNK